MSPVLSELIGDRLKPLKSSKYWEMWEHKTLNIHRAVLKLDANPESSGLKDIEKSVRQQIAENFKRSWWRGFGFGVVAELKNIPSTPELAHLIDIKDNKQGTWQWLLFLDESSKQAVVAHTSMRGYLTPIYEKLTLHYESQGYTINEI